MTTDLQKLLASGQTQMIGGKLYAPPPSRALLGELRNGQFYLTTIGKDVIDQMADKMTAKAIADVKDEDNQPIEQPRRRGRPPKAQHIELDLNSGAGVSESFGSAPIEDD